MSTILSLLDNRRDMRTLVWRPFSMDGTANHNLTIGMVNIIHTLSICLQNIKILMMNVLTFQHHEHFYIEITEHFLHCPMTLFSIYMDYISIQSWHMTEWDKFPIKCYHKKTVSLLGLLFRLLLHQNGNQLTLTILNNNFDIIINF